MKLSDVVSSMHLTVYAEVPLLVFMGVFIGVCVHMLRGSSHFAAAAELPLRAERRPERKS
jgi:cbb3-type cytochrome oxidase subunit 3